MQCEEKRKCPCGGEIILTTERDREESLIDEPFHCSACKMGFETTVCRGELKPFGSEGSQTGHRCQSCGHSVYGKIEQVA